VKLLFLDIDGVLNAHEPHPNGYCGIIGGCRERFNMVMDECPDVQVVISSAWRYHVHNGQMNLNGLEELFLTHGLSVKGRIHGITDRDDIPQLDHWTDMPKEWWSQQGSKWRKGQIEHYVSVHRPDIFVVVDDLDLDVANLIKTDPKMGLSLGDAHDIIRMFK